MRYLYVIGDVFVTPGTPATPGDPPPALLAPNLPFTVWTQDSGGSQVTDLVAQDGALPSTLNVDGSGNPVADSNGLPPRFRGPDVAPADVDIPLWIDNGSGQRFPVWPLEAMVTALENALVPPATSGGGTGNVSGATLTGTEYRYVTIWENSDHTYPVRPGDLGAQEAVEWVGTVDPATYSRTARYDKWTRLP